MEGERITPPEELLVSIIIPVYNECDTLGTVLEKVKAVPVPPGVKKEIVIVNDGSNDGSETFLKNLEEPNIRVIHHERNQGKGAAVRTALKHVRGNCVLIQDADLEYDPNDYPKLIAPFLEGSTVAVVFGSRFLGEIEGMKLPHFIANKVLTIFTNVLFNARITDLCTGYKLYRTAVIRDIPLERDGFDLEHELTAKLLHKRFQILEVPIVYKGRDVQSGKKVRWTDFFRNIYTLLRYRFG